MARAKPVGPEMVKALAARGLRRCSEWHWRKRLPTTAVDFWPSTGKLRWLQRGWIGGLPAVDRILAVNGEDMPNGLVPAGPRRRTDEDGGIWITIGADCPWNPTPGERRFFRFETEEQAATARANGFMDIPDFSPEQRSVLEL